MDIRCRKLYCKNNKGETCTLKGFVISENKECENFEFDPSKENEVLDVSKTMLNHKQKFAPFKNIKKFDLKCEATNCIFNCKKNCKSNGLTILSKDKETASCANYFPE